ncbi:branched-chain amino acid ABC transporter permease [Kordiimonas pumila]|uniref:Branched-chain amino acid ABC transporter permease n=1 Tax=Kordiimonas pumila TaxID=2161677 RepID=A0ABV7D4Q7_9PROT|nr:branched-chain amino acid ABC transporter permease [Kordiimonas pumila]
MYKVSPIIIVCGLIVLAFAGALADRYLMDIFILTCFYGTLAISWNLMGGMAGLVSLGHALFVGIGAYTVAWCSVHLGWPPLLTWPLAVVLAMAVAFIIGMLCFRYGLKGYFFGIATLAFSEVAFFLVSGIAALGRSDGIMIPLREDGGFYLQFYEKWPYGLIIAAILIITLLLGNFLLKSRTGYYWQALRDNEEAAEALGIDTRKMKMRAFVISAAIAGLCGAFYANYISYVDPRSVLGIDLSIQMLVFSIIGGMSLLWGPLLGAAILVPLDDFLRSITSLQGSNVIVYATLLILLAIALPQGIGGWFTAMMRRRKAKQAAANKEAGQ